MVFTHGCLFGSVNLEFASSRLRWVAWWFPVLVLGGLDLVFCGGCL